MQRKISQPRNYRESAKGLGRTPKRLKGYKRQDEQASGIRVRLTLLKVAEMSKKIKTWKCTFDLTMKIICKSKSSGKKAENRLFSVAE